jgi:chemotaxis response regulator CheB
MTKRFRIVAVDDSVTIRAILETLISREPDLELVGLAGNTEEALRLIDDCKPDVVTIDVAMPGIDGLALLDALGRRSSARAVMLSSQVQAVNDALARGAFAFFEKARIVSEAAALLRLLRRAGRAKPVDYRAAA